MRAGAIGVPRFEWKRLNLPRHPFRVWTTCFLCSTRLRLTRDDIVAAFTINGEIVGVVCDDCLGPDAREQVARVRRALQSETR